ncbi:MAG: type I-MYXAN CRISPR-associated protein Cas6/Cmx6 [Gammaproteobacteria bacterium]|nr:type I-MYXAN CRISPR-associated protein Cas6/Cmx6 [Gammaproteobacteria bacterium]
MFWSEEESPDKFIVPDTIIDLSFKVSCKQIKLDHAWSLTEALSQLLPWFKEDPQCAIHHIYIPQSGNGWARSDNLEGKHDDQIHLSRRTRFKIRIPRSRLAQAQSINGQSIMVDNNKLTFGASDIHLLSSMTTIVARHVYIPDTDNDEETFLKQAQQQINALDIQVRKMLCGKTHQLNTSMGSIKTRSLMIADISPEESLHLQEHGVGDYYSYGCGIFIPQKGISSGMATE